MLFPVRAALLAAALALPGPAKAQPSVRVTGYGEFSVSRELGFRDRLVIDGDDEPIKTVDGVRLLEQTDRIEARLCRRFGVRFVLDGTGPEGVVPVIIRSRHPEIRRPNGEVSTGGRYASSAGADRPGWVGFTFDHPWELVPGTWSFAVMSGDAVLAERSFIVTVPPDADQPPPGGCGAPVS